VSREVLEAGASELKKLGFALHVGTPWRKVQAQEGQSTGTRTIWIDLASGREALWGGLQKKWRHGVGFAKRAGVCVEQTRSPHRVTEFFRLCQAVSESKGFDLPASESLLSALLESPVDAPVASHLFIATFDGQLAAGAFILRCGRHIHYFWGATDRELAKNRPGEALHWAIIEWALVTGCTLYDLEGIDPKGNAGTYEFKRKMGGKEIGLPGIQLSPLDWRGRLIAPVVSRRG
jgi:lipid II:glycine glycyltransferase (peptidoglycan interpeptide bridge formation enzyme)